MDCVSCPTNVIRPEFINIDMRIEKTTSSISVRAGLNVTGIEIPSGVVYSDDSVYDHSSDKCVQVHD